jgi:hypothetical protein
VRCVALVVAVVLAGSSLCRAEVVSVTATLAAPGKSSPNTLGVGGASLRLPQSPVVPRMPDPNTFEVVCELAIDDPFFGSRTASDSDVTTVSGTSRFQLDCTFDEDTHAATSVNGIKFLYGDGAGGEGPLKFDDISFTLDHTTSYDPVVTLDVWSTGLGGSNSTGRQERDQDPNLIPFVPVSGSEFLLDTRTTPKSSDFLLYLSEGSFSMSGLFEYTWDLATSNAWNDGRPMPGRGSVTVGTPSIAGLVATYDVDVSIPIVSAFPVWNPGYPGAPNLLGSITATGTMVMSGQFTREVVPEPSTVVLLLGLLVAGLAAWRCR